MDLATLAAISHQRDEQRVKTDLRAFMRRASPQNVYPTHLGPYLDVLDRAAREPVRCVVSAPPRHTKTETTLHKEVQLMHALPGLKVGNVSYNDDVVARMSRTARRIATRAGLSFGDSNAVNFWELTNGSSFSATGIGGSLTSLGFHLVVVDDPFKNREEAESPTIREKVYDSFMSDIFTRRQPVSERPTSFIVVATRWHPDDLSGRLIAQGWPNINLPAISDKGEPLWPSGFPLSELRELEEQLGPYAWGSLYQGQPRQRGESVFTDPTYYDKLPETARVSIGVDVAYTSKTYSDFSVAVVLYHDAGKSYVADVYRSRDKIGEFRRKVVQLYRQHGGRVYFFGAHTEKGVAEMFNPPDVAERIPFEFVPAVTDKFVRAQPVAAAWRAGKVLIPRSANWLGPFLNEVLSFTGVKDAHDDVVDGLSSSFYPYERREPVRAVGEEQILPF